MLTTSPMLAHQTRHRLLRRVHTLSAWAIGAFVGVHVMNHLVLVASTEQHIQAMKVLRAVYRFPPIEMALIVAVGFQVFSGLRLLRNRLKQRSRDRWWWAQVLSGGYLAYFFVNHVGAVFFARHVLKVDSNIYFATVGLYVSPFQFFFYPYYFLAISAVFMHIACAVRFAQQHHPAGPRVSRAPGLLAIVGPVLGLIIVAAQGEVFHEVTIPDEFLTAFHSVLR